MTVRIKTATLGLLTLAAFVAETAPARAADDDADARRRLRRTPIVEAVERAAPSVVSIGTTRLVRVPRFWEWDFVVQERPGALGSGVIVHPAGYVVTNAHVINQAAQIAVKLTGLGEETEIPASLVAVDLQHDLALLQLEKEGPYPAAEFGSSDDLMVGETAIAMGNPFGLGRTVTVGVISALNRDIEVRDQVFEGLIQTDAAVNQGNSGGALLNLNGEWIGVNSAIYSLSGGSDGISFAIPVKTVRGFLAAALRPRRIVGKWLGIELGEKDDGTVVVRTVFPVGPAADAGIEQGAELLDSRGEAHRDIVSLTYAILDAARTGKHTLHVRDGDSVRDVELAFAELPTDELSWERLGVRCVEVTPEITEKTGYREGAGVFVAEVREGSPAARIGLRTSDLLVGLGDHPLRTQDDLLVLMERMKRGDPVDVHLVRPERSRFGIRHERWKARLVAD
jgi:serine protease Do